MPFNISDKRLLKFRALSRNDLRQIERCQTCRHKPLCGGFETNDDSRGCDRDCEPCRAVCCRRDDGKFEAAIEELGALDITEAWAPWELPWPHIIWGIDGRLPDGVEEPCFVLPIDAILDHRTRNWWKGRDLKDRFNIPPASFVGLSFAFKDWLLDWFLEDEDGVLDRVAEYPWDFVIAPNWSVYLNYPRIDQLVNIKRRFQSMTKMQDRGLLVVPDMAWNTHGDVERMIEWVTANRVHVVHMNFQTVRRKTRETWMKEVGNALLLRSCLPSSTSCLVTGLGLTRLSYCRERLSPFSVINSSSWKLASMKMDMKKRGYSAAGWSTSRIYALNRKMMKEAYNGQ